MRIPDDVLLTVVFIGYHTDDPSRGGIECVGTAFLLEHEGHRYLVTARHIAEFVGGDPFLIRVNRIGGGADNLEIDQATWFYHDDPSVDVAVLPFDLIKDNWHYVRFIDNAKESWWSNKAWKYGVGIGDLCYTIGLFRILSGNEKNLPVVHFGTIARPFIHDEPIPITDWRDPSGKRTLFATGYLVESQSLSGLSGSPVFVRVSNHMIRDELIKHNPDVPMSELGDAVAMWKLHLIGVWQGAWDLPPGKILMADRGRDIRVPVGMGVVVPIDYVHYILANKELTALRKRG